MDETFWAIYRDESERGLLAKVQGCLRSYRSKYGAAGNVVGVASSLSREDETTLRKDGVKVMRNLPAWAKSEIWVGREI